MCGILSSKTKKLIKENFRAQDQRANIGNLISSSGVQEEGNRDDHHAKVLPTLQQLLYMGNNTNQKMGCETRVYNQGFHKPSVCIHHFNNLNSCCFLCSRFVHAKSKAAPRSNFKMMQSLLYSRHRKNISANH